jgi:hypothetical protein
MGAVNKPCLSSAWLPGLFFSNIFDVYLVREGQGYKKAIASASEHFERKPLLSCWLF